MIRKLFDDYGIRHIETGNHHCRPGWVQICCPMCIDGDSSYHMGYNLKRNTGFTLSLAVIVPRGAVRLLSVSIGSIDHFRRYVKTIKEPKQFRHSRKQQHSKALLPVMREIVKGDNTYNYLKARFSTFSEPH